MYFQNRAAAGRELAAQLEHHKKRNIFVLALSPGGAIVGAQIAMRLHANMSLLLTENINLPGEPDAIGAIGQTGNLTYNDMYSAGQLEELTSEFYHYIEGQRIEKFHKLHVLMGHDGEIHREYLRHHVVIVVSDGLSNGFSLDVASEFLKTIATERVVIATPLASVTAVDRMHLLADEICCLNIVDNYMNTDHYYDDNTIPEMKDLFRMMSQISVNWKK